MEFQKEDGYRYDRMGIISYWNEFIKDSIGHDVDFDIDTVSDSELNEVLDSIKDAYFES